MGDLTNDAIETARYHVASLINAQAEEIIFTSYVNDPKYCPRSGNCVNRDIWGELKKVIDGVLEAMTLQDLVERPKLSS